MEYKYRFTITELVEYCLYTVKGLFARKWKTWFLLIVLFLLPDEWRFLKKLVMGEPVLEEVDLMVRCILVYLVIIFAGAFLQTLINTQNDYFSRDVLLAVRNGRILIKTGRVDVGYSCANMISAKKKGRFIVIRMKLLQPFLIGLPRRALASREEEERFLEFLKSQKVYACQLDGSSKETERYTAGLRDHPEENTRDFEFEIKWDRELSLDGRAEILQTGIQKEFLSEEYKIWFVLLGLIWLGMLMQAQNLDTMQVCIIAATGIAAAIAIGVVMKLMAANQNMKKLYMKLMSLSRKKIEIKFSRIVVNKRHIYIRDGMYELWFQWKDMGYLLESGQWFLIYNKKKKPLMRFPKSSFTGEEERRRFVIFCQEQGLEYCEMGNTEERNNNRIKSYVIPVIVILLVLVIVCNLALYLAGYILVNKLGVQIEESQEEPTTEYVFHPEDFENYLPLEKQIGVLKSLGIKVPEKILKEERDWMEEYPSSREWIEGEPYYVLLSDVGYPVYDEETYEIKSYSNQMYTVDWDGYDLTEDYVSLLNGVNAISRGEFRLTSPAVTLDGVDMDSLTGTAQIYFLLNGTPYLYELEADGYYLDTRVLRCLNEALGKEQIPGRLYGVDYDGWSCILFYQDREWAAEFTGKTGIPLMLEYVRE